MLKATLETAGLMDPAGSAAPEASDSGAGIAFGDYLLEQEIAHGGMGVVYRARQKGLDRTVAVKLLLLGRHASAESIDRFRREARSAAALQHPNIVAIYEVGEFEGQHFFSMEFIDGPNLAAVLNQGLLSPRLAAEYAKIISETIHYAHERGVLHRDLKPSNILLDVFGALRITDFGLAKRLDGSADLTESGRVLGSPNYLSPEAATGRSAALGPGSDIYAVGAMLYEFLTGRPPFLASSLPETLLRIRDSEPVSPRALIPSVPRDLETICLKCLEKEPSQRYVTALALAEDLGRWLGHRPILARPTSTMDKVVKWGRRQPRLAVMTFATVFAVLGTVLTLLIANLQTRAAQKQVAQKAEESRQRLVRLSVLTGNRLTNEGDGFGALLWYAEALRLDQGRPEREEIHRRRFAAAVRNAPILAQFWQSPDPFFDANFSPDGSRLLLTTGSGLAQIWDTTEGRATSPLITNGTSVDLGYLVDDGRRVALSGRDGQLRFWDSATGKFLGPAISIVPGWWAVNSSTNGQWLWVCTTNGLQRIEATSGRVIGSSISISNAVDQVLVSRDGRRAAVSGTNQVTRFWDLTTAQTYAPDMTVGTRPGLGELSGDGKLLVAGLISPYQSVVVWDVAGAHALAEVKPGGDIFCCKFSPDGRRFATTSWDGAARVYDSTTGLPVCDAMRHLRGVANAVFSPDGRRLATASWDGTARIWDPDKGRPASPMLWHAGYVLQTWFSPNGRFLLSTSEDHTARLWSLGRNGLARLVLRHEQRVNRARFSPDGSRIVSASDDSTVRIWSRVDGSLKHRLLAGSAVLDAAFDPSGQRVAVATVSGVALIWRPDTPGPATANIHHAKAVRSVCFSPDGARLLTASDDFTARVWMADTGRPVTPPLQHQEVIHSASFSPDGRRVVTASQDRMAQVWDAETGARCGSLLSHPGNVASATFSPDGTQVLTANADEGYSVRAAQAWDAVTGKPMGAPLWHRDGVICAVFSPDGRWIASGGEDAYAMVWDAHTSRPVTALMRHESYVLGVAFSPDSRLLLTFSSDFTARVWDVADGEPVTPRLEHGGEVDSGVWSPDGKEVLTASADGTAKVWDISPTTNTPEAIRDQAELFSAHRLADNNQTVPLTAPEMKRLWDSIHNGGNH